MRPTACLCVIALAASAASAEYRAALLIGNGAYADAALASPAKDIEAVGDALAKRGFVVTRRENLDDKAMQTAVKAFAHTVPTRGTALVYFSGYVMAAGSGERADNCLVPIGGNPHTAHTLNRHRTKVGDVLATLKKESGAASHIVIADGVTAHPKQKKDAPKGLVAREQYPDGAHVIYPAPAGVALDKPEGGLSPLAKKLSEGLSGSKLLDRVLTELSPHQVTTLPKGLGFLAKPAATAVSPPDGLRAGAKAGDEWINPQGIIFVWCPPGRYTMGSPDSEAGRRKDEAPRQENIANGFWIAKHEMTRRQAVTLVGRVTYKCGGSGPLHPIDKSRKDDPVKWLAKLNESAPAGWAYALPTEAEWEYAARAGTSTPYSFGASPAELPRHANFADLSLRNHEDGYYVYAHKSLDDGFQKTAPVGSFAPNAWGLHDMHGNVSELCVDVFKWDRAGEPAKDAAKKFGQVIKGGSWVSTPEACRSAHRNYFSHGSNENARHNHVGFRFVIRKKP